MSNRLEMLTLAQGDSSSRLVEEMFSVFACNDSPHDIVLDEQSVVQIVKDIGGWRISGESEDNRSLDKYMKEILWNPDKIVRHVGPSATNSAESTILTRKLLPQKISIDRYLLTENDFLECSLDSLRKSVERMDHCKGLIYVSDAELPDVGVLDAFRDEISQSMPLIYFPREIGIGVGLENHLAFDRHIQGMVNLFRLWDTCNLLIPLESEDVIGALGLFGFSQFFSKFDPWEIISNIVCQPRLKMAALSVAKCAEESTIIENLSFPCYSRRQEHYALSSITTLRGLDAWPGNFHSATLSKSHFPVNVQELEIFNNEIVRKVKPERMGAELSLYEGISDAFSTHTEWITKECRRKVSSSMIHALTRKGLSRGDIERLSDFFSCRNEDYMEMKIQHSR